MKKNHVIFNIQQMIKLYCFFLVLFTIFRIVFLLYYSNYLIDVPMIDIVKSLWYGMRISLKTVGIIILVDLIFCLIPNLIYSKYPVNIVRKTLASVIIFLFSVSFFARIIYYKIFNSTYDLMVINGFHDDLQAILATAINEYNLLLLLPLAFIVSGIISYLLFKTLDLPVIHYTDLKYPKATFSLIFLFVPIFFIFSRFGGAFNYHNSVHWENIAKFQSHILNENVLDDAQALYRVYCYYDRANANAKNISPEDVIQAFNANNIPIQDNDIDRSFYKQTFMGMNLNANNVVLILGESLPLWPQLPEYQNLQITPNLSRLMNSNKSIYTNSMLSHGTGTMPTVNGFVSGLPPTTLYENYSFESFEHTYQTGIANNFKKLGYKTIFWYGGFESWQNIKNFIVAQSFDEFHDVADFNSSENSAWGCPDSVLFDNVKKYIEKQDKSSKFFHVILTTSNHPPYVIDLEKEGFDVNNVKNNLPANISNSKDSLVQLGHIWYTDKTIGNFISAVEMTNPESLFVITGDHAERFTFNAVVDLKTFSAVPCIFYGQPLLGKNLPFNTQIGSHLQIMPTLIELLAPKNYTYVSTTPSLFENPKFVFNHKFVAYDNNIYLIEDQPNKLFKSNIDSLRNISTFRILNGSQINK